MVNLRRLFLQTIIYRFLIIWVFSCFSHDVFSAMNVGAPEGEEAYFDNILQGNSGMNKVLTGTLIMEDGQTNPGSKNVLEGTLVSKGPLSGLLTVYANSTYRSATTAEDIYSGGNLETSAVDGTVAQFLTLNDLIQTDPVTSVLSVKVFPDGTSDYFSVNTAVLTGKLKVYVAPGDYDTGGVIFSIIRGATISGNFISLMNPNAADVALSYQRDADNFYLIVSGNVPYVAPTTTVYIPGLPLNGNERHDDIKIGSSGGFNGFETPEDWCKILYINFMQTGTVPEQNTIPTNDYAGFGTVPDLPESLDEIWLTGDPTGYDILVAGGAQYALPCPGVNTRIRFALTKSPVNDPLNWFQGPLPAGCTLVIEPGSADPFINSVIPSNSGKIIIGSHVILRPGFNSLFEGSTCTIQGYPGVPIDGLLITLTEPTRFPWGIFGLRMSGPFRATFGRSSNLINPYADSATDGGYTVEEDCQLTIYRTFEYIMPEITSHVVRPALNSGVIQSTNLAEVNTKAPKISPPL